VRYDEVGNLAFVERRFPQAAPICEPTIDSEHSAKSSPILECDRNNLKSHAGFRLQPKPLMESFALKRHGQVECRGSELTRLKIRACGLIERSEQFAASFVQCGERF